MQTVLITGGAGFLGSHLCRRLIDEGYRVICMDNLITGKLENLTGLNTNNAFEFIEHDVTKYIFVEGPIDYVLHFASPASPNDYLKFPIKTLKVGSLGTHNALGVAKAKGARFLLASTSEVYGDPLEHPQREDYWGNVNPIGLRGVYDEAKRFAESITMAYHRSHGVDTKIARIFNTYGPKMRRGDGRAVPAFIEQALKNEPITIFGDGYQTRSFCYINDLIEGLCRLLFSDAHGPINIGNPDEITIITLANRIKDITGSKSEIVFQELPMNDPKVRQPDITSAGKILSWQPAVALEDGLKKTIEYFREDMGM